MSFVGSKTRYRVAMLTVAIVAAGVLGSCGKAPKQVLRLGLVPGNSYVLSVRTESDAVITSPDGNSLPIPVTFLNTFLLQAGDVDERGDTFVSAQFGATEFPLVFVPLATIVQAYSFGFKLSPLGKITEFVNTEPMRQGIRELLAGMGDGSTPIGKTTPDEAITYISDDALRAIIEPFTTIWPGAPVTAGDEWTGPAIYSPRDHAVSTARYRLESLGDSEARIAVTTEVQPATDRARDPNIPPSSTLGGKGSGEIRIDTVRGLVRSYELNSETSGTFSDAKGIEYKVSRTARIQAELTAR